MLARIVQSGQGEGRGMTNRFVTIKAVCHSYIRNRRDAKCLHGISDCGANPVRFICGAQTKDQDSTRSNHAGDYDSWKAILR
jgi:hypothetical protein